MSLVPSHPSASVQGAGEIVPAASAADAPALEWSFNPWKEHPAKAVVTLLLMALVQIVLLRSGVPGTTAAVLWIAATFMLAPVFSVMDCRVDGAGVARRMILGWERRPWDRIARARLDRVGLFVSPHASPHRLDSFRGLWLPLRTAPSGPEASLEAELRRRLEEHGL